MFSIKTLTCVSSAEKAHSEKGTRSSGILDKVIPEVTLSLGPSLILSLNLCFIHIQSEGNWVLFHETGYQLRIYIYIYIYICRSLF